MGQNLVQKIISAHLVDGKIAAGQPIAIRIIAEVESLSLGAARTGAAA